MKKFYGSLLLASLVASMSYGMDAKAKSGFFAGVDLSAAQYNFNYYNSFWTVGNQNRTTFNYGIKGGYQFYGNENHGLRVGLHLNMGNYSPTLLSSSLVTTNIDYYGLRYGVDVDYLYDFYNTESASLGLSVGIGYELANYVGGKGADSQGFTAKVPALFGNGAYLNLGAHYYIGHSQIEVGLRLPSIFGTTPYYANENAVADSSIYALNDFIVALTSAHISYSWRF